MAEEHVAEQLLPSGVLLASGDAVPRHAQGVRLLSVDHLILGRQQPGQAAPRYRCRGHGRQRRAAARSRGLSVTNLWTLTRTARHQGGIGAALAAMITDAGYPA
jgi:hypothetical protein